MKAFSVASILLYLSLPLAYTASAAANHPHLSSDYSDLSRMIGTVLLVRVLCLPSLLIKALGPWEVESFQSSGARSIFFVCM